MIDKDTFGASVGMTASFSHTISEADVLDFARVSGDYNALHTDETFASTTQFKARVVHGMFLGALASRLVGMHLPGGNCLYLKQTLSFKNPAFIGDSVTVKGEVISRSLSTGVLTIDISISKDTTELMKGEAYVKVLDYGN